MADRRVGARCALRPHPVLRLDLSRTATSSSTRGRRRAGPRNRVDAVPRRARDRDRASGRRARRALRRGAREVRGRRSTSLYIGGGTPSLVPADGIARARRPRPPAVRPGRRRRGHARGEPGRRRAGRSRRPLAGPGVTRISFGAQSLDAGRAETARAAARARRRRRRRRRGARGRHRLDQPRPPVRRPRRHGRLVDDDASRRRSRSGRTTCRSTP